KKTNALNEIQKLVSEYEPAGIVVGLPLTLAGDEALAARDVREFMAQVSALIDCPLHWVDERMTTVQAERSLIERNMRRKERKTNVDKVAAALILRTFLDMQDRA